MTKKYFMPKPQGDYLKWHDNLKAQVSPTTPGAVAGDVTMVVADNALIHAKITAANIADAASYAAHKDLTLALASSKANARKLAKRIKENAAYTEVVGKQLQIIGAEDSTDMTQERPVLDTTAKMNGVVEVGFNKLLAEGVHFYGRRDGEAEFTYLASETHSPYVDNRPLLVAGKPETRQYKAVFLMSNKQEIGLESDVAVATARP